MVVIGFRCWPDKFSYVVLKGTRSVPQAIAGDVISGPTNMSRAGVLNWVSKEVTALLTRHKPTQARFKAIEPMAMKNTSALRRAEIEGVLQASLYECGLQEVTGLTKGQMKAKLEFDGSAKYVVRILNNSPLADFSGKAEEDAAVAAWCALEQG
jgi:Holliday junction resolvasome RuvABC endonuclease subunit